MNRRVLLGIGILLIVAACGGGETAAPTSAPAVQPPAEQPTEAPAQEGYQGGAVSDGGTIVGTISYNGEVEGPTEVTVDKDNEVCGDTIEVLPIVRDASGGLQDVVADPMYATGVGLALFGHSRSESQRGTRFRIRDESIFGRVKRRMRDWLYTEFD